MAPKGRETMEDLNEIAIYTRVVERKSFSAAAQELRLSPSGISKRVTALEERLGVRLLNRSTRRLSLTEAGAEFYERCSRALSEITSATNEAAGQADKLSGQIKVYSTLGAGLRTFATGLIEFSQKYPQLSVDLTIGTKPLNLIEHGIDLVIRSAELSDASIDSRVLMPVSYHVVAAPSYLKKHGTPRAPKDLAEHNCLVHTARRLGKDWTFITPEGRTTVHVSGNFSTNSGATLAYACLSGMGITLLPSYSTEEHIAAGRLVPIFPGMLHSDRFIRAFFARTRFPQPKVMLLIDFLADYLQSADSRSNQLVEVT
jgi:DNA-binding transcriptional LysR family regulator